MRFSSIVISGFTLCCVTAGAYVLKEPVDTSAAVSVTTFYRSVSPCGEPLTYRIARIDPHYSVTRGELRRVMGEVDNAWSEAAGRNIIDYRSDGEIALHLIYSREQRFTEEERRFANRINTRRDEHRRLKGDYDRVAGRLQKMQQDFKKKISRLDSIVKEYNRIVTKWNGSATIPEEVKQDLSKRKKEIEQKQKQLERERNQIEKVRDEVNRQAADVNQLMEQVNDLVKEYNDRFQTKREFNQGNYVESGGKKRINIYQFSDLENLRLVLAHEVGHALGLDHVENPRSVMYYLMDRQATYELELTDQDIAALDERCREATGESGSS